jgi:hypothetical protein
MAEAAISLKLTPAEFDLVREVLEHERSRAHEVARDIHTDSKIRHAENALVIRLTDLLSKLR